MKSTRLLSFALILSALVLTSCKESTQRSTSLVNNPKSAMGTDSDSKVSRISFTKTEHDFGRLIQGEKVIHIFRFSNTGNAPLVISSVSASCGCTASKYTTETLAPGEEGQIEVTFDSSGQKGIQNKTITVLCNGQPQTTVLRLKAQVSTPLSY